MYLVSESPFPYGPADEKESSTACAKGRAQSVPRAAKKHFSLEEGVAPPARTAEKSLFFTRKGSGQLKNMPLPGPGGSILGWLPECFITTNRPSLHHEGYKVMVHDWGLKPRK